MRKLILIALFVPVLAFAGKEERDYRKAEVDPALAKAGKVLEAKCGCAVKLDVNWDQFKTRDQLYTLMHFAENISSGAPDYCGDDAESKKAFCKMKTLSIVLDKEVKFTFSGNRGIASTDGNMNPTFKMITDVLDQ
jgi:hypothetical protein